MLFLQDITIPFEFNSLLLVACHDIWYHSGMNLQFIRKNIISYQSYLINFPLVISCLLFLQIPFFKDANNVFLDMLHGEIEAREEIVIISIDDESLAEIGAWPWDRSVFAQVLENLNTSEPAVVGLDILFVEDRKGDQKLEKTLKEIAYPVVFADKFAENEYIQNKFEKTVKSGYANFVPDNDGKVRITTLSTEFSEECLQSFSTHVFQEYLRRDESGDCSNTIYFGENYIVDNEVLFNYTRSEFISISFSDIYSGEFDKGDLKDKIVLIGLTATDLKSGISDNLFDVFGKTISGVEVHVNILNSLLEQRFQKPLPTFIFITFILTFSTGLLFLYQKLKKQIVESSLFLFSLIFLYIVGIIAFEQGINWPFVPSFTALGVSYIYYIVYKYLIEYRENRFVKSAFSHYINPALLQRLVAHPEELALGGEKKEVTILFSDIRGFTSIAEKLSAEELITFTNLYLDGVSEIIMKHHGTIDKYIGDAVLAFWNAPLTDKNHQAHAMRAACELKEYAMHFSKENPSYPKLRVRIGLNSGKVIIGNIGGKRRFDYTVLGDEVNLASRIEGLTKKYGIEIITTESVVKGVIRKDTEIIFRLLDEVIVKGKTKAVKLFQPLQVSKRAKSLVSKYEEAFALYQKGAFDEAIRSFKKIEKDTPSKLMIERISDLRKRKEWDGVWRWSEK